MHGNPELLSACCLGYRHAPYVRDCIASIWQGGWPHIEIVAMDDGSMDGSQEILETLQKESPCRMTVLKQGHTGNVAANFNRLLAASQGKYVLFSSLDDMQMPGTLEKRMRPLLRNETCLFAAHTCGFAKEENGRLRAETTPLAGISPDAGTALNLEHTLFHSFYIQGAVFRKTAIDAVNAFDEDMLGDDLILRTKLFRHLLENPGQTFALLDEPGFIYRRHAGNLSKDVMRQLEVAFQYCERFRQGEPYPEMLKNWLLRAFETIQFKDVLRAFTLSGKAAELLLDEDVQDALRISAAESFLGNKGKIAKGSDYGRR